MRQGEFFLPFAFTLLGPCTDIVQIPKEIWAFAKTLYRQNQHTQRYGTYADRRAAQAVSIKWGLELNRVNNKLGKLSPGEAILMELNESMRLNNQIALYCVCFFTIPILFRALYWLTVAWSQPTSGRSPLRDGFYGIPLLQKSQQKGSWVAVWRLQRLGRLESSVSYE